MADKMSFFRNYNYDICLATDNIWTVAEAVDYLAAYLANRESWYAAEDVDKVFACVREQLLGVVRQSIASGILLIDKARQEYGNGDAASGRYVDTVDPLDFINWAIDNNLRVPEQFEKYAADRQRCRSLYVGEDRLKTSRIHHERCRAVAELLWNRDPEMSIADMARTNEIAQYGCEGYAYEIRTICRWLASLKAERRPGRRRKEDGFAACR